MRRFSSKVPIVTANSASLPPTRIALAPNTPPLPATALPVCMEPGKESFGWERPGASGGLVAGRYTQQTAKLALKLLKQGFGPVTEGEWRPPGRATKASSAPAPAPKRDETPKPAGTRSLLLRK